MGATTQDLSDLQDAIVREIRRYFRAEGPESTLLLRQVARLMVEARSRFTLLDGTPDWQGRSGDYRRWIGEAFTQAGVEDRHNLQSALRYHTGLLIRERLSERELEEFGFIKASPREVVGERRAEVQEVYSLATGSRPLKKREEREEALRIVRHMLDRVERGSDSPDDWKAFQAELRQARKSQPKKVRQV